MSLYGGPLFSGLAAALGAAAAFVAHASLGGIGALLVASPLLVVGLHLWRPRSVRKERIARVLRLPRRGEAPAPTRVKPALTGVPETMLWTLHNRAAEAKRPCSFLKDAEALRIYEAINYDFERSFGPADDSHPMRSKLFDDRLRPWLAARPSASVVELAAGLETQFQRCDDGHVRWWCLDLPEVIALRRRFLPETARCRYLSQNALDLNWTDRVDSSEGVFVTAQGLFMYLDEADVRRLVVAIVSRFDDVEILFDAVPRWFSNKTLRGFRRTEHYVVPRMPWGIGWGEIAATLRSWSPAIAEVDIVPFGAWRGIAGAALRAIAAVPGLRNVLPTVVHVKTRRRLHRPSRPSAA